jgi:Domain of unknown function (DUF4398)
VPLLSRLPMMLAVLVAMASLTGCAGAPVQEMSNARQAVRAAEKAGAAKHAPEQLAEAQALLKSAETNLRHRDFRMAREEAERARSKAIEARRVVETATASPPSQP